jgi:hypothetical protein
MGGTAGSGVVRDNESVLGEDRGKVCLKDPGLSALVVATLSSRLWAFSIGGPCSVVGVTGVGGHWRKVEGVEIDESGLEEIRGAGRDGVVIDRMVAAEEENSWDFVSLRECSFLRDDEERYGLVLDRLFAVADERVYGRRRNRKWAGDTAEAAFLHKAMELGLVVRSRGATTRGMTLSWIRESGWCR